jgi:gamma-glutamylcyclotransferase (GGCT)/AIG2-like uncharacterized protein YtfP
MTENNYYFAYGSNMDTSQMNKRCSKSILTCPAKLRSYRFIINARGVATVVQENTSDVYGILWRITSDDEQSLDGYEGVKWGTYRKANLNVETTSGQTISALIYIARDNEIGSPRNGYMEKIIAAAKAHSLPKKYLEELSLWLTGK